MAGLVLEGGTFRAIFTAGILDAFLDEQIEFPYVIGVSAGISYGISYVSKQRGRNLEVLLKYRNDKRYLGRRNYLKCRSIFGMDFVFEEISNHLMPFDRATYEAFSGKVIAGITNVRTGKAEYRSAIESSDKYMTLRATCAMPVFFPTIKLGNQRYYDGGLSDAVPIKKSIKDGNQRNVIVLTRPKGYKKTIGSYDRMAAHLLRLRYPKISQRILDRCQEYNDTVRYCEQLEREGKAIVLRPEYVLDSFEANPAKLQANYDHGYQVAKARLAEIKELF